MSLNTLDSSNYTLSHWMCCNHFLSAIVILQTGNKLQSYTDVHNHDDLPDSVI